MSIITFAKNIKMAWEKELATKDDIKQMYALFNDFAIDYCSFENILEDEGITKEEFAQMIVSLKDEIKELKTAKEVMKYVLRKIDEKDNKPQKPTTIMIDEELSERTTLQIGSKKRFNELKDLIMNQIHGTYDQMTYVYDIETHYPKATKFVGKTYKEMRQYIDEYAFNFNQWKNENGITKSMVTNRKFKEDINKGVGYYGR